MNTLNKVRTWNPLLSVSGERKSQKEDQKKKFHRIELSFGTFRRSFTLPEDADSTKVTAESPRRSAKSAPPDDTRSKIKSYAS